MTERTPRPIDGWRYRRRVVFLALLFCAGVIVHAAIWQNSAAIAEVLIANAFWTGGAIIGSYVFGAIWDDRERRRNEDNRR